jgi:hypothetical protein
MGTAGFTPGTTYSLSMALDANDYPVVAYSDGANGDKLSVMRWNGTAWTLVGTAGFTAGSITHPSLAITSSGNPVVAFRDHFNDDRTSVMRWTGSAWAPVGYMGISAGLATYQSLALDANNNPVVAFTDDVNGWKATVMRWNGTAWNTVGMPGLSRKMSACNTPNWLRLDPQGDPVVVYPSLYLYAKRYSSITTGMEPNGVASSSKGISLSIWPNPNNGHELHLLCDALRGHVGKVTVDIHDIVGKKLASHQVPMNGGTPNMAITLEGTIPSGVYMVTMTAGERTFAQRLVIQ